jgi:hypothetical protein
LAHFVVLPRQQPFLNYVFSVPFSRVVDVMLHTSLSVFLAYFFYAGIAFTVTCLARLYFRIGDPARDKNKSSSG